MQRFSFVAITSVLLLAGSGDGQFAVAQDRPHITPVCPTGRIATAAPVFRALSQQRLGWFRRMYGLTEVEPRSLRPVRDAATCAQLETWLRTTAFGSAPWEPAYYQAGGYYFLSLRDTTDPHLRRKVSHFYVFDSALRPIAHLAPK